MTDFANQMEWCIFKALIIYIETGNIESTVQIKGRFADLYRVHSFVNLIENAPISIPFVVS